jgi:hypothetical protein
MMNIFQRRLIVVPSILISLALFCFITQDRFEMSYWVFVWLFIVLVISFLLPRLVAEYRLAQIESDIDELYSDSDYGANYREIKVVNSFSDTKFLQDDREIGILDGDLSLNGKLFKLTERDFSNVMSTEGDIIATSKLVEDKEYSSFVSDKTNGFILSSLNFGDYPFGIYNNKKGIGFIRCGRIILPRSISLELQIFAYSVAQGLYNKMKKRRQNYPVAP